MAPIFNERLKRTKESPMTMGFALKHEEEGSLRPSLGTFIFDMRDAETGEQLHYFEKKNIITRDAGIAAASHFKGDLTGGLKMLAVGTGATGALLSPDAPQAEQRALNNEIQRKAFSSTTYRNADGVAVSYPTNIVDYTATFAESEAVGALNEMALVVPASINPAVRNPILNGPTDYDATIDVRDFDLIVNYLTFACIAKPATAVLSLTWRLTF
jgi:hypothetical protein